MGTTMQRFMLLLILVTPAYHNQLTTPKTSKDDLFLKKTLLLSDLRSLDVDSTKLDKPAARALAKAEVANAAWTLDREWAKNLLREAYELTLPEEEERIKVRNKSVGAALTLPTAREIAQNSVRNRVFEIASRDKALADELNELNAQLLGKQQEHHQYESLASKSIASGDNETAGKHILKAVEADPTLLNAGYSISDIALRDRRAADKLILQYIERLRAFPLSFTNESAMRIPIALRNLVFPDTIRSWNPKHREIAPPGPEVMRAYVNYVIESVGRLEQSEPGGATRLQGFLLSAWLPIQQYAPDFIGPFLTLEKLSRRSGENVSLPQMSQAESAKVNYEERVKKSLESRQPDEMTINFAISRADFDNARKMIDLLSSGKQKTRLTETVNTREAVSLADKGDIQGAVKLAAQLSNAASIMQVYSVVINHCIASKDSSCVSVQAYQAVKQLHDAEETSYTQLSFSKLAKIIAPVDDELALKLLDEMVTAANRSSIDEPFQDRMSFDADIFRVLAGKDEYRVQQAATALNNPLSRIIARSTIYYWKATELEKNKAGKR